MKTDELIMALQKLKVQTGSLACIGCKHEDTCGMHGCALIREAVQEAADDATVQLRADMATQKALWLAVCSVADAYGFGPERMKKFFIALQENNDEITRMEKEVDTDYAYEKLRLKAERVTGMKIEYLYEHEAQEEQV